MANEIQLKRSSVANKVPDAGNVLVGEPVINLNDKIIFTKDTSGNIIVIGAGTTANVIENGNLYFSNARVSAAISSQTLGNATFSGNVGIGTLAYSTFDQVGGVRPLTVSKSDSSTTIAGSLAAITIANNDTTTNNTAQINFAANTGVSTNQYSAAIISAVFGARTNGQYPAGQLVFSTSTALNFAPTEKMRITSAGNVELTGNISVAGVSRLGTVQSGTWNGSSISTTYTDAKVTSVNGQTGAATGFATTANSLSQFASTTSAQLATLISDETGTGSLVFAASPVLSGTLSVGGTANIMSSVSNTTAQIKVSPASGASNANSKINFQGTFFNYPADTGARLTATIKSGFSAGAWGTEYLDILVNNGQNDISSEANQNRVVRVTKGDVDITGNIITSGSIELGNASDTTIARSAAGVITVEGVEVVTLSRTQTLTNKTLTSPTLTTPALGLATGTSVMLSANIGAAAGNVSGNFTAGNFQTTGNVNSASGLVTGSLTAGTFQTAGNVNSSSLQVTTASSLGTVQSGTWNGSSISTTYTDAKVTTVAGSTGAISNAMILSALLTVDGTGSGLDADLLDGQSGSYYIDTSATAQTKSGNLTLVGTLSATTKSFVIKHPTKEGMQLRYGSLEGPENGVYVRGNLKGSSVIDLPEYWVKLVDPESISVQLTPIGRHQKLFVEDIIDNSVIIGNDGLFAGEINCFYTIFAERVDVGKLQVEI